jgi:MerR family transcriptional regulator, copper efflux regulator
MTTHPEAREPVLACTLDTTDAAARAARWRRLLSAHLRASEATAHGRRLSFGAGAGAELEELVAAERVCCPFLDLVVAPGAGGPVLEVAAPDEARAIVEAMFAPS